MREAIEYDSECSVNPTLQSQLFADKPERKKRKWKEITMASLMKLYGIWISGPSYKVGLMLHLCGEKFEYHHVNLREGQGKTAEYLAINHFGQVPALVDGDVNLVQSAAILEYLSDKTGKFGGVTSEEKAKIRSWIYWDFDRLVPGIYRSRAINLGFMQAEEAVKAYFKGVGDTALEVLNKQLSGKTWLEGERATIADIDIYGTLIFAGDGGFDVSQYSNIAAWMKRLEALPGYKSPQEALPKP